MLLEKYLQKAGHTNSSIKSYLFAIGKFLSENIKADEYSYKDILNYLSNVSSKGSLTGKKLYLLYGMRKYYDFLIDSGIRNNHPCRGLILRCMRNKNIIHQDLFSTSELELLMDRENRYVDLIFRNRALVSLLIYQGLTSSEISALNIENVDLHKDIIKVKRSKCLNHRVLSIHNHQKEILLNYVNHCREKLLKTGNNAFLVGKLGNRIAIDDIHYLIFTYKGLFPDRKLTPSSIRQSVIANWLNEKKLTLEKVQYMCGQKRISTTLRYRQLNIEYQRKQLEMWFPI
jgi:integrase/recombinase XerD